MRRDRGREGDLDVPSRILRAGAPRNIIPFAWPIIVINAPLFESYLDDEGELHVKEIKKGLLIWKNPIITRHTLVQIYTKDQLLSEAKEIRESALEFLKLAAEENDRLPREK